MPFLQLGVAAVRLTSQEVVRETRTMALPDTTFYVPPDRGSCPTNRTLPNNFPFPQPF